MALVTMLAVGCSSQEQPPAVTDSSGSGSSNGNGGGTMTATGDGGVGVADGGAASSDGTTCDSVFALVQGSGSVGAAACHFTLAIPPPAPNAVLIYADQALTMLISESTGDGWSYDDATDSALTLSGSFCDDAMAGKLIDLWVVYGCPGHPIP